MPLPILGSKRVRHFAPLPRATPPLPPAHRSTNSCRGWVLPWHASAFEMGADIKWYAVLLVVCSMTLQPLLHTSAAAAAALPPLEHHVDAHATFAGARSWASTRALRVVSTPAR